MAINQSELIKRASLYREPPLAFSQAPDVSAFLCHSHKDEELVKGLLVLFEEVGLELYVDWLDKSLPDTPSAETARKIQEAIKKHKLFFFLATSNAKASRWCPWEIGYADSSQRKIFIIPTTDKNETYGNEYLQLYSYIDDYLPEFKKLSVLDGSNRKYIGTVRDLLTLERRYG